MGIEKGTKLHLLLDFPKGMVLTATFLREMGFNSQLTARYKKGNWLESLKCGAYKRCNEKVDWRGGLSAMQKQLNLPVHCGARTALEMQGYSHYAEAIPRVVYLFGLPGQKLPEWFDGYNWGTKVMYKMTRLFPYGLPDSFVHFPVNDFTIQISSPERAAMEMLYHVPSEQGFDEAERIMESMLTLRPHLVQELLEKFNSVKVKRLFIYMAEKNNLPWMADLNLGKVGVGNGDRTVVKGGRLDPKYRITVPRSEGR